MWRAILVVALACGGCNRGPQLGEVSGRVTWHGKPLGNATVIFTPDDGQSAFARTREDGSYELKFADGRSGALVGDHAVGIGTFRVDLDAEGNPIQHPEILPVRFNRESTLVRTVEPGAQVFDFDLNSEGEN